MLFQGKLKPWMLMWLLAFAIYVGCKWLTLWQVNDPGVSRWRVWAYFFCWPGMDAPSFLSSKTEYSRPASSEWVSALFKTILGAGLIWGVAHLAFAKHPLATAWLAGVGYVLFLHFGMFHPAFMTGVMLPFLRAIHAL